MDAEYFTTVDHLAEMAWLEAVPLDNPYGLCPCGCGRKWRFVVKDAQAAIDAGREMEVDHEAQFKARWKAEQAQRAGK